MKKVNNEVDSLRNHGWTVIDSIQHSEVFSLFKNFGPVIHTTDVTPKINSKAALNSDSEMQLHTDHPRARWISWECFKQSSEGGFSLLKDAYQALGTLSDKTCSELKNVSITTHRVFKNDLEFYPVLRTDGDKSDWVYYTPWMKRDIKNNSLTEFENALDLCPTISILLQPGQILVIDNARMLHGRSALGGDKNRLLIRRWIASPFDNIEF